jgi:peptidyl-prolyl cis-trans isomerase
MPAGSVWEVYIPQQLAYGEREQGQIKPFSVLIFKIELISVAGK